MPKDEYGVRLFPAASLGLSGPLCPAVPSLRTSGIDGPFPARPLLCKPGQGEVGLQSHSGQETSSLHTPPSPPDPSGLSCFNTSPEVTSGALGPRGLEAGDGGPSGWGGEAGVGSGLRSLVCWCGDEKLGPAVVRWEVFFLCALGAGTGGWLWGCLAALLGLSGSQHGWAEGHN